MFTHTFWEQAMNLSRGTTGNPPAWGAETGRQATTWDSEAARLAPADPSLNRAIGFAACCSASPPA